MEKAQNQPLKSHPASEWFPMLADDELEALKNSIKEQGLLESVVLCDGQILDGRNRYKACVELGIEARTVEYEGDSPVAFAWAKNHTRRHLTCSQLALIATEMLPQLETEAKRRQASTTATGKQLIVELREAGKDGVAVKQAAKIVGVSASSVSRAKAVKKANPALAKQIMNGDVSVDHAYKVLTGRRQPRASKLKLSSVDRAQQIKRLVAEGHRASQIADALHIGLEQVRNVAKKHGIKLPDASMGRSHHAAVDPHYLIGTTTDSIEALVDGLRLVLGDKKCPVDFGHIVSKHEAIDWDKRLQASIKVLNRLHRSLHWRATQ